MFCINGLNLLALCTYFRGNHSLLSIGQKSSLALQPSWSGREGGGPVLGDTQASAKTSSMQMREELGPGLSMLLTEGWFGRMVLTESVTEGQLCGRTSQSYSSRLPIFIPVEDP